MIKFKRYTLNNGLRVILHQDKSTQMVAVNTLFKVGAKHEDPQRTGFAHLFEHLMFGGSANIPSFDTPLQFASGDNNAFTNNDITNYYITLPSANLELALWLESDRMKALDFSQKALDVQKSVVIEEFKQRYLNQPYGDVWLHLRPLAYTTHPYKWATIGEKIEHIEEAVLEDVKEFFYKYYLPNNAILCIAGNIEFEATIKLIEKWYGDIPEGKLNKPIIAPEPLQTQRRTLELTRNVPLNAYYRTYHMAARNASAYYATDFISDVLSAGQSSRFYQELIKETNYFNAIDAYVTGSNDPGLFVISATLNESTTYEKAEVLIDEQLRKVMEKPITEEELFRIKNKAKSSHLFGQMEILDKAMNLAYFEHISSAEEINKELEKYDSVSIEDIQQTAQAIFKPQNSSVLYYHARK